eukprot:TRINITY_DN3212_c1_g2_i1.p2 TRINITY_DN3212_c1_g2~~TRINITY_DN3212_c1_g2_i1.p2  ORF type:complete len:194 (-),score=24.35 TRINITY_DN3212_c1_g2_i1:368-949(-)
MYTNSDLAASNPVQEVKSEETVSPVTEIDGSTKIPQQQVPASTFDLEQCIVNSLQSKHFTDMLTALQKTEIIGQIAINFTVLTPTNDAMRQFSDNLGVDFEDIFLFTANIEAISEVIMLHLIKEFIVVDDVQQQDEHKISTLLDSQSLNFGKGKVSVDGSGINSTVQVLPESFQLCNISFLVISEVLTTTTLS